MRNTTTRSVRGVPDNKLMNRAAHGDMDAINELLQRPIPRLWREDLERLKRQDAEKKKENAMREITDQAVQEAKRKILKEIIHQHITPEESKLWSHADRELPGEADTIETLTKRVRLIMERKKREASDRNRRTKTYDQATRELEDELGLHSEELAPYRPDYWR